MEGTKCWERATETEWTGSELTAKEHRCAPLALGIVTRESATRDSCTALLKSPLTCSHPSLCIYFFKAARPQDRNPCEKLVLVRTNCSTILKSPLPLETNYKKPSLLKDGPLPCGPFTHALAPSLNVSLINSVWLWVTDLSLHFHLFWRTTKINSTQIWRLNNESMCCL